MACSNRLRVSRKLLEEKLLGAVRQELLSEEDFSNSEWEEAIMRIITSRDKQASASILRLAHDNRDRLGHRWYRLLQLGLLWSALSHLSPRYDNPPKIVKNWNRWLSRLRKFKISNDVTPVPLDPISLAGRVERFENHRWERLQATKGKTLRFPRGILTTTFPMQRSAIERWLMT